MKRVVCRYPQKVLWWRSIESSNPLEMFSAKTAGKIRKTQQLAAAHGFQFIIEPVTEDFLDRFVPIYSDFIQHISGTLHDVRSAILHAKHHYPYQVISFYQEKNLLGALIFSNRSDHLAVAYRVVPHRLPVQTPISISYVGEMYFNQYAVDQKKRFITHGSDRNCYGHALALGLADYKYRIGYAPRLTPKFSDVPPEEYFDWDEKSIVYILLQPSKGEIIADALLLAPSKKVATETLTQYAMFQKPPSPRLTMKY